MSDDEPKFAVRYKLKGRTLFAHRDTPSWHWSAVFQSLVERHGPGKYSVEVREDTGTLPKDWKP